MRLPITFTAACLLTGALASSAWAQNTQPSTAIDTNPIGKVITVSGTARIQHANAVIVQANLPTAGSDNVKIGELIYRGDIVQTGVDGALGIIFADGTSFSCSNNAQMELNEYVYDPHGNANATLISLTKGTFDFIAGSIAKSGNMKVDTPVGTIGIRGTAPRVEIFNDGSVKFTTMMEKR